MNKNKGRTKIAAGNWKMNLDASEAKKLAQEIARLSGPIRGGELIVFPPYPYLDAAVSAFRDSRASVGAQELYFEEKGAFTGAVSGLMIRSIGCEWTLVGHSERRAIFGETLETSNKRVKAALSTGLRPMLCVGETLQERKAGSTLDIVIGQLEAGLNGIDDTALQTMAIAYEPVWAIGTGEVASPQEAQDIHAAIRQWLCGRSVGGEKLSILYGGSVKPDNAEGLMAQEDIDGALVGGASLKADSFIAIARAVFVSD